MNLKTFIIIFGLISIIALPQVVQADDDTYFSSIYNKIKTSSHEEVLSRMSKQTGLSSSEVDDILEGSISQEAITSLCKNDLKIDGLFQCMNELQNLYQFERSVAQTEAMEKELAYASEIWANGTKADSSFDLVVDLNIIDVIYFGSEAQIPKARIYDPFSDDNDETITTDTATGDDTDNTEDTTNDDTETDTDNDTDDNEDRVITVCPAEGECTEVVISQPVCASDPSEIVLDQDAQQVAEENTEATNQSGSKDQWYRKDEWTGYEYNYKGGTYPSFYDENSDDDSGSESCSGQEVGMFGNMWCIEKFCTNFICIDIKFIKGSKSSTRKENCIKCLLNYASEELEEAYNKKESLNPSHNTPVIFDIRNFFLGNFNIKVFIDKKPPPSGDRQTRDQDYTVAQEVRFIQTESFPLAGAAASENTDQMVKNRDILNMILENDCEAFLARIPSYASTSAGEGGTNGTYTKCAESREALKSPLLVEENSRELLRKFKQKALETRKEDYSKNYWEEIQQYLTEFSGMAIAINDTFMEFPNAAQINAKKTDCKTK